jgi:predicted metal-binding protein
MKITLCATCHPDVTGFAQALGTALPACAELAMVECMSGCTRPATVAFRASGKTAYLFGDLGPEDLEELAAFARLYQASTDGNFPDARVLGKLRTKAVARIPG